MAYDTLDPLDSFVDRFRMMCGGDHVIVGPPGSAAQANMDRHVIQVIGPARGSTEGYVSPTGISMFRTHCRAMSATTSCGTRKRYWRDS